MCVQSQLHCHRPHHQSPLRCLHSHSCTSSDAAQRSHQRPQSAQGYRTAHSTICCVLPVCAVRCALCGVRCAVCAVRCALCAVRCVLCAVRCALCALWAVGCGLCAVGCARTIRLAGSGSGCETALLIAACHSDPCAVNLRCALCALGAALYLCIVVGDDRVRFIGCLNIFEPARVMHVCVCLWGTYHRLRTRVFWSCISSA